MSNLLRKITKSLADLDRAHALNSEQQFKLALKYFKNSNAYKNDYIAFEIFSMAAEKNHVQSLVYIARMYNMGIYVKQDKSKAIEYLKKASDLNGIYAKCILGNLATTGLTDILTPEEGVQYYKEAADLGSLFAKFCLGEVYKNGIGVEKNYEKAIKHYLTCLEAEPIRKNLNILADAYCALIQMFLELHYIEEANANRDITYYKSSKKNKEEAKKFLDQAKNIRHLLPPYLKENFENSLRIYDSILSEDKVDISKMSYGEFRKLYYNKHPRIFLTTKKSEHQIYVDGIKSYFFKRDDAAEELEYALQQKQNLINKRKQILKRVVSNLKISKTAEEIKISADDMHENFEDELKQYEKEFLVDYSTCVINLDKYLEEILHQFFVVEIYNHKKSNIEKNINAKSKLINKLIGKLSVKEIKHINSKVNKISPQIPLSKISESKHANLLRQFVNNIVTGQKKNTTAKGIEDLSNYYSANAAIIDETEAETIKNIFILNKNAEDLRDLSIDDKFLLGSLFQLTFVNDLVDVDGNKISTTNKLKPEIVKFVQQINPKLSENEIYLKLQELILKVEHFRVMVRNVASHKAILTQKAIEKGINLCIVQDSSIFNLLDELFGEYIEKQIHTKDAKNLISQTQIDVNDETISKLVEESLSSED